MAAEVGNGAVRRGGRQPAGDMDEGAMRALGLNTGWAVFSYLLSRMAAYGAIGWLIGRAVHVSLLLPVGMLVGLAISTGFVIYRYGVQGATAQAGTSAEPQKEMDR